MSFLTLLPMAFVMVAGPQILSSVFLATTEKWRRNSSVFLLGAAVSVTTAVSAAYFLGRGASKAGASNTSLYIAALVLILAAMVHAYVTRKTSKPPKWMDKLTTATPRFAFTLGVLLLGIFPTDILTSWAVGTTLAAHHDAWWHVFPFVGLTLLLLGLPALALFAFGARGERFLPKARNWMTTNAWVVNEVVLAFFLLIVISDLAG